MSKTVTFLLQPQGLQIEEARKLSTRKQKFRKDDSLEKGLWGIKYPQNGRANEKQSLS